MTTRRVRQGIVLALAGLLAGLGIVAALFWDGGKPRPAEPVPHGTAPAAPGTASAVADLPSAAGRQGDAPPVGAESPPPAAQAGKAAEPAAALRFDIVRVEPNGDAVVAGRGKPNTVVEMLVDGRPVAKALADPTGQFAIVPPPLPKGASEIVLRSKSADGQESRSSQSIAVSVSPTGEGQPLVALTSPDAPTVVLSQPSAPTPAPGAVAKVEPEVSVPGRSVAGATSSAPPSAKAAEVQGAPLRIVSVDGEGSGRLFVTGVGVPGTEVRLYLNDTLIAPVKVGADGRVTFTIGRGVAPGRYTVRVEEVAPATGKVIHRAEVRYVMPEQVAALADTRQPAKPAGAASRAGTVVHRDMPARSSDVVPATPPAATAPRLGMSEDASRPGAAFVPAVTTARITRGDNLWQISKRTYGRGQRYTVIYDANQDQIRDPDLIYPGQTFVLPVEQRG